VLQIDSEDEWEEEVDGESLGHSEGNADEDEDAEDGEPSKNDLDYDDGWLCDDAYVEYDNREAVDDDAVMEAGDKPKTLFPVGGLATDRKPLCFGPVYSVGAESSGNAAMLLRSKVVVFGKFPVVALALSMDTGARPDAGAAPTAPCAAAPGVAGADDVPVASGAAVGDAVAVAAACSAAPAAAASAAAASVPSTDAAAAAAKKRVRGIDDVDLPYLVGVLHQRSVSVDKAVLVFRHVRPDAKVSELQVRVCCHSPCRCSSIVRRLVCDSACVHVRAFVPACECGSCEPR
jgi:hypothetical protein